MPSDGCQGPTTARDRNEIARDSFSYLHLPMVAGIVLLALGLKKTLEHVDDPLKLVPAAAMLGGIAIYLLAHVAFRWRNVHRFSTQRVIAAVVLAAFVPAAEELPALVTLAFTSAVLVALIVYETVHFAELRERLRHQLADRHGARLTEAQGQGAWSVGVSAAPSMPCPWWSPSSERGQSLRERPARGSRPGGGEGGGSSSS